MTIELTSAHVDRPGQPARRRFGAQSMIAPLRHALVHLPGPEYTESAWRAYGLSGNADRELALREQRGFLSILERAGVSLSYLEQHASLQCTATYDPALITDAGAVILESGREERRAEAIPMARRLLDLEIPIIGWIGGEGRMDAGDTLWLDHDTLLAARSYRTNAAAIAQLRQTVEGLVPEIVELAMPHWHGPRHVLHLMSVVSLVDHDLAVVYPPAAPIPLLELLRERGHRLIEVSDEEFDTQGANVLALAPRVAVICAGNPRTSAALRDAGVELHEYQGGQISIARVSGPTCNTRPLLRA